MTHTATPDLDNNPGWVIVAGLALCAIVVLINWRMDRADDPRGTGDAPSVSNRHGVGSPDVDRVQQLTEARDGSRLRDLVDQAARRARDRSGRHGSGHPQEVRVQQGHDDRSEVRQHLRLTDAELVALARYLNRLEYIAPVARPSTLAEAVALLRVKNAARDVLVGRR